MKNEERWRYNYTELKSYIEEHGQLPDKKRKENRRLLNWWKYNRKLIKLGKISNERAKMLAELSETRRCFMQTDSFL